MTGFTPPQLRLLRNASAGVSRVTRQLEETIYEVAYLISDLATNFDTIKVAEKTLQIVEDLHTGYKYLVIEKEQHTDLDFSGVIFDFMKQGIKMINYKCETEPFSYSFKGTKPSREDCKWFAENTGEIIQQFIDLWKGQEDSLKRANAVMLKRHLRNIK